MSSIKALTERSHQSGFTLIEILVVVVILGVLAAMVVPRIMERPDQARIIAAKNDIRTIISALKLYRLDSGPIQIPTRDCWPSYKNQKPATFHATGSQVAIWIVCR